MLDQMRTAAGLDRVFLTARRNMSRAFQALQDTDLTSAAESWQAADGPSRKRCAHCYLDEGTPLLTAFVRSRG